MFTCDSTQTTQPRSKTLKKKYYFHTNHETHCQLGNEINKTHLAFGGFVVCLLVYLGFYLFVCLLICLGGCLFSNSLKPGSLVEDYLYFEEKKKAEIPML